MITKFKSFVWNLRGWHTNRKIIVIESDDWGSIRMPSKDVKNKLQLLGMNLENDPYSLKDGLATQNDLSSLFEVLNSVKDSNNRPAVITANTNVANPDFKLIKESNYEKYFYEPFTITLNRIDQGDQTFEMWKTGIKNGLFFPQFHGREHLNIKKWLNDLKNNHASTRIWFDFGSYGTSNLVDKKQIGHYMTSWESNQKEDIKLYSEDTVDGLNLFNKIFNFKSESIIATTYCWPVELESVFKQQGVRFIQGIKSQRIPTDRENKFKYKKTNFLGKKSKSGLIYLNRNSFFEPSQKEDFDWVNDCLYRISLAFKQNTPVTISTHRINFVSRIDTNNATKNLKLLRRLLHQIVKKWPDVEFMNSVELGNLIQNDKSKR